MARVAEAGRVAHSWDMGHSVGQCGSPHNNNHWPAASQRPGPQLHDESESLLLVISLSAQIIPLAFSDVVAECV